ncbi:MAG: diguanylate cyclase [Thermoanaerobaculia bacterium]|nr:diguanylate cyclase [Thermoanaerobaculia bacterium]
MSSTDTERTGPVSSSRGESSPAAANPRILVIDDSELSRKLIGRILSNQGYRVITASDGAEGAVVALREHPHLVVTDLEMPVLDGYGVARLLKSDPATDDIPVLMLTVRREASSRFWGLETGADAYILKDELSTGLVPAVENLLEQSPIRSHSISNPPRTPLEVLARVSRHLDARLLEAVLVNRILERGMQAQSIDEAGQSILGSLAEFVDCSYLGIAIKEEDEAAVFCVQHASRLSDGEVDAFTDELTEILGPSSRPRRELSIRSFSGSEEEDSDPSRHRKEFRLPLRNADGVLLLAPKRPLGPDSREIPLLEALVPHLALVLDNARLAQRLRELSMIDGLTKLLNRRTVTQRLQEELSRAVRYEHALSVVLCDLDHFKRINDTYGHQAGDKVLIQTAEIFRQLARSADIAGRYGGEEFLLVLPETELDEAAEAAHRLLREISDRPMRIDEGQRLTISASLGAASLSELEEPSETALLALADKRLYQAKDEGRGRAVP